MDNQDHEKFQRNNTFFLFKRTQYKLKVTYLGNIYFKIQSSAIQAQHILGINYHPSGLMTALKIVETRRGNRRDEDDFEKEMDFT